MHKTPESKLAGRYTALNTSDKAIEAMKAASANVEAFRNKAELQAKLGNELSALSPEVAKLVKSMTGNLENDIDGMRLATAKYVLGVQGAIIEHFKLLSREAFLSMSDVECAEAIARSTELFKRVPTAFPVTK